MTTALTGGHSETARHRLSQSTFGPGSSRQSVFLQEGQKCRPAHAEIGELVWQDGRDAGKTGGDIGVVAKSVGRRGGAILPRMPSWPLQLAWAAGSRPSVYLPPDETWPLPRSCAGHR